MTDRLAVASLLVKHIAKTVKGKVNEEQLAGAVDEIELESQIEGSSFIKVHLIDPYWTLATSDFLARTPDGMLDKIECEFPEHSGWWWRLVAVEISNSVTQPNVVLVFEDRIVAWLREAIGEKVAPPGTTTRAQFAKTLLDEVGLKDRSKKILPVIPSLNVLQPVESKNATGAQEVVESEGNVNVEGIPTPKAKANAHAKANKTPGVGAGAAITIKGVAPTSAQQALINEVLAIANEHGAGQVPVEALIEACIDENDFTNNPGGGEGSTGLLQLIPSTAASLGIDPLNVKQCVTAFLTKGFSGNGGAIAYAKAHPNAPAYEVAQAVQASGAGEASKGAANYGQFAAEAKAIISAGGGVTGGTGNTSGESDIGQLQRGTTQNPDENSFECIERLAKQVRWFAFTDGQRFFYMDGFDFERQKPSAYLDIPANQLTNGHTGKKESGVVLDGLLSNMDNTEYSYQASHKKRGKAARKSTIAKPQSPSEIHLPLTCEPLEYRAGDVFVIQNSGPLNGRWVVTDAVRKYIEDPFTTFTLEPPQAPYPEPQASSKTGAGGTESSLGPINSVVEAAKKALKEKSQYQYSEASNRANNGTLFGPSPRTMDCSSFAILCYKAAKQPDPSGANYGTIGNTDSLIGHMVKTDQPQPGDLAFFGSSVSATTHVNVVVGNGNSISMGKQGDPSEGPTEQMGPSGYLGVWRPA
jgi:cell wall-associated NlpC family hydrolase